MVQILEVGLKFNCHKCTFCRDYYDQDFLNVLVFFFFWPDSIDQSITEVFTSIELHFCDWLPVLCICQINSHVTDNIITLCSFRHLHSYCKLLVMMPKLSFGNVFLSLDWWYAISMAPRLVHFFKVSAFLKAVLPLGLLILLPKCGFF